MRRSLAPALALAAVLSMSACSTSPCQTLGERVCACTGLASDTCKTQVEDQLKSVDPSQSVLDRCAVLLTTCTQPPGAVFCEWLNTQDGMVGCGLAPEPIGTTAP
jgi:hypothetical protein